MDRDATPDVDAQDTELAELIVAALASRRLTFEDLLAAVTFDDDAYFVPAPRQAPDQLPA